MTRSTPASRWNSRLAPRMSSSSRTRRVSTTTSAPCDRPAHYATSVDETRSLHEESTGALALRLRDRLDSTLAPILPRGTRAALINYPNHHNVGDPAIYLGTLRTLRRLGVHVTYRCEH